jgi:hypothetical protein
VGSATPTGPTLDGASAVADSAVQFTFTVRPSAPMWRFPHAGGRSVLDRLGAGWDPSPSREGPACNGSSLVGASGAPRPILTAGGLSGVNGPRALFIFGRGVAATSGLFRVQKGDE